LFEVKRVKSVLQRFKHSVSDKDFPRWMYLMFDRCNSRCQTCNIWSQEPCSKPLKPEDFRRILSSELFRNIEYIGITGGEPTLFDLYGFFRAGHEVHPKATLNVSSNGLLPHKLYDVVSRCLKEGMRLEVGLSLDGVGEFHDYWRGVKDNFVKVDWLIHKLSELRLLYPNLLTVGVGSTLTLETAGQADALVSYCRKLNVPFMWHWFNFASFYHNDPRPMDTAVFESAVLKVMGKSIFRDMWLYHLRTRKFPRLKCRALSSYFLLNCDGTVRPCLTLWDHSAGNMLEHGPLTVWHSEQAELVRKIVASCHGCLNKWACDWNLTMSYPAYLVRKAKVRLSS